MERLNDILKSLIGILLLVSFVAAFSSCNSEINQEENESFAEENTDTVVVVEKESDWEEDIKQESRELEARLDTLGKKVKEKGGKLSREVESKLEELDHERKELFNDSTEENIKQRWKEFKIKANRELDSLDRKI